MMEPHDPCRIDENISPSLADVALRLRRKATPYDLLEVSPPGAGSPDVPEPGLQHAISTVELPSRIDQKGPTKAGILEIGSCEKSGFEGHNQDLYSPPLELSFDLLQLHQMSSARQSAQMPVKDHQEP
jgi:hypothetical protein